MPRLSEAHLPQPSRNGVSSLSQREEVAWLLACELAQCSHLLQHLSVVGLAFALVSIGCEILRLEIFSSCYSGTGPSHNGHSNHVCYIKKECMDELTQKLVAIS